MSQLDTQGTDYKIEYRPYQSAIYYNPVLLAGATVTGTGGSSTTTSSSVAGNTTIFVQDGDLTKFPIASSITITLADNSTHITTVTFANAGGTGPDILTLNDGLPSKIKSVTYFPNVDWAPWPGERILDEPEFPVTVAGSDVERLLIRFTIAGGRTQGKLKAAQFKVEGIKKTHREILTVATTGTLVDLTGRGFRKITSVSITPANTGTTITQAGVRGQAYDLLAKQQPGVAGTTYELSGPKVVLSAQGDASVTIEGY